MGAVLAGIGAYHCAVDEEGNYVFCYAWGWSDLERRLKDAGVAGFSVRPVKGLAQKRYFTSTGRAFLREVGITSEDTLHIFCVGYCDGALVAGLGAEGRMREELVALGLTTESGELFERRIVLPLWDLSGRCTGMCGLRTQRAGEPVIFLPNGEGLMNWRAAARGGSVVLCESVLDALALHQAGVTAAVPCHGREGFTAMHETFLERYPPKEVAIVFPARDASRVAAAELGARLGERFTVRNVELPEGCTAIDLVKDEHDETLRRLVLGLPPRPQRLRRAAAERIEELAARVSHAFVLQREDRRYEV